MTTATANPDQQRVVDHLIELNYLGKLNNFTNSLLEQWERKGYLSDKQIAAVLRRLDEPKPEQSASEVTVTEPGVYESPEGIFVVKPNRDKTRLYAKKLVEIGGERLNDQGEHVQIEFEYAPGAIYRLHPDHKMPLDRAKELTIRYGRCIVCNRHLKAAQSVEQGIGPVCIKSFA